MERGRDHGGPTRVESAPPGIVAAWMIAFVRAYQRHLSPWLGRSCRFDPTCSEYFVQSVRKKGALRGSLRGLGRIARCHPWSRGGHDPP